MASQYMDSDILAGAICPKKNMSLSDNKYDKRIINESDKNPFGIKNIRVKQIIQY